MFPKFEFTVVPSENLSKPLTQKVFVKMPKQKKPTATTTTTPTPLRRSPRILLRDAQTPNANNPDSQNVNNVCAHKPWNEPTCIFVVCGITSVGSKKYRGLSNGLRVSKSSENSQFLADSDAGLRRYTRFSKRIDEGLSLRRSTRLSSKGNTDKSVEKCARSELNKKRGGSKKPRCDNGVSFREERGEVAPERSEKGNGSSGVVVGSSRAAERDVCKKDYEVRVSRKRNRGEQGSEGGVRGWTKEQEMALQRAYFAAKPTPNFWKKVSKLVPGKSAQDCFDKIHSGHITPLQPQPRSRARKINSSPIGCLSLSASKLLNPSGLKTKRPISNKQKSHLVHKTVRQLLQKCNRVEQDYEADLFSVLEPNVNSSTQDSHVNAIFSTPKQLQEKQKFLQKYDDKNSELKNALLKSSSRRMNLVSPPVLKQVKNRALHERYIDQLHTREAKRNAAAKRAGRLVGGKENLEQTNVQKVDIVKTVKDALVSDARDGIKQLQNLQANATETCSDLDDGCVDSMDDEAECGI